LHKQKIEGGISTDIQYLTLWKFVFSFSYLCAQSMRWNCRYFR